MAEVTRRASTGRYVSMCSGDIRSFFLPVLEGRETRAEDRLLYEWGAGLVLDIADQNLRNLNR